MDFILIICDAVWMYSKTPKSILSIWQYLPFHILNSICDYIIIIWKLRITSFFCWVYIKAPCVWATHRSQVYPETFKWLDIEINSIQFYGYYLHRENQWPVLWPVDITFLWRIGPIQCKGACDNFVKILLLSTK